MTTVRDLMSPSPHTIGSRQSIQEATHRMRLAHVRHLPVLEGARLVGVISDRDVGIVETLGKAETVRVEDVMSPEPFVVNGDEPLRDVVSAMAKRKIGSAVVVEGPEVVGIFTTTDALHLLLRHLTVEEIRSF